MSKLIPAVGYIRRSSDSKSQEKSIPEQTAEVQKYADEKGYKIVRWYKDDAISGDDTENRAGFLQMIRDAQERRDFKAIICWDRARFGRFNSIEYGFYVHPLCKAGVYLATVMDGVTDWNDASGRIVANVMQEGKHAQLIDHSANVVRGQKAAIANGGWVGSPPYGYCLEGKKYNKRLVIDDPGKVNVVRRIFKEFTEEGRGFKNIAQRLNADAIVSPTQHVHGWHHEAIKFILSNPAYCGDMVTGRASYGKYHRIKKNDIVKLPGGGAKRSNNPEAEWTVRRDTHESIIDRLSYEKARTMIAGLKQQRKRRQAPEDNPYVLSGALRCGSCGGPLHALKVGRKRHKYYECAAFKRDKEGGCDSGTIVRESVILESLGGFLESWLNVDALGMASYYGAVQPGDLPEAFAKVKDIIAPKSMAKKDRARIEKELTQTTAKIAKARGNLALLDAENIPAVQAKIKELVGNRDALELELKKAAPVPEKDINAEVLSVLHNLVNLAYCCRALAKKEEDEAEGMVTHGSLESAAPAALRRFLGHTAHITVHTVKEGSGTRTRHAFTHGELTFRAVGLKAGELNPDFLVQSQT